MPSESNEKPGGDKANAGERRSGFNVFGALSTFRDTFGLSPWAAVGASLFLCFVVVAAIFWFIHSAPPRTLIITGGPPGSMFERYAETNRDFLLRNGVTLKILPSQGSLENLKRLSDPDFQVDIGFVQAGETSDAGGAKLFSLGSIAHLPLLIFYRSAAPVRLLSEFAGKKLAIGPPGSGTRLLALTLLETNGIKPGGVTTLLELDAGAASAALLDGRVDAVFLMGDSASSQTMRTLLHAPGVQLYDFVEADAYVRKLTYLNKMVLPEGGIDFGADLPPHDVTLIGPTVDLIARADLHPALSDLLLESAQHAYGKATLLQRAKEFPADMEHEFRISSDAARFYQSGKKGLYHYLPFWLASLVNRMLVTLVPLILIIPSLKLIPTAYKWRVQLRIYRWYRSLIKVEREAFGELTDAKRKELRERLDYIESSVNQMRVPASFGNQFYGLREHIGVVRERIGGG